MKLLLDISRTTFTVTREVEPKVDRDTGAQRTDRNTKALLWVVQVMALDATGGEMLTITVAGDAPKVNVGQAVLPVELEAIPWAQNGRNGVAFRASSVNTPSGKAAAA